MEGAGKEVRRRVVYRVFHGAPIFAFLLLVTTLQAQNGSDFLVVENVDHLLVYNKYQQEITDQDSKLLVPFVPMRILKAADFLSDGFTRCMQVEINDEIFFLLKDTEGKLTRSGSLGFESTFHNPTIILDTV